MITYNANFYKPYWKDIQKDYDIYIGNLNFSSLECSDIKCKCVGYCKIHAYYERSLILPEEKIILVILRVICKKCNTTHAILPSFIVPYSQVPLEVHIEIIKLYEKHNSTSEDEKKSTSEEEKKSASEEKKKKKKVSASKIAEKLNNTKIDAAKILYIIRQYKDQWRERLKSLDCTVTKDISKLVKSCFDGYKQQFMQIKCTPNVLYFLKE